MDRQRVAIFPGSFDPFTKGHKAIVDEALNLFDRVVVAIGHNPQKRGLLSVERRKQLIERLFLGEERVEVTLYTSLTGDEARRVGATTIIRSARNTIDFDFERTMERANREIFPELSTVLLFAPRDVEHISSSLVRELRAFGHDTSELLPEGISLEEFIE
ncbi:MAG: pantetheine-phosphate adenylyltransferase [Alistipes sp.]|jgi:pantetheine-phosphate adenylyltransferase|nr:pantetheine-phosphate adenylyltransferase [Alistipes sp.]